MNIYNVVARLFHKNIFFSAFSKDILYVYLSAAKLKRRFEFLVIGIALFYEFHDAVNTYWFVGKYINKEPIAQLISPDIRLSPSLLGLLRSL